MRATNVHAACMRTPCDRLHSGASPCLCAADGAWLALPACCAQVGRGQITDDGELTLCLASALAGHDPAEGLPAGSIAHAYMEWLQTEPFDVVRLAPHAGAVG